MLPDMKIMIVEDDSAVARSLLQALEREGYRVDSVVEMRLPLAAEVAGL